MTKTIIYIIIGLVVFVALKRAFYDKPCECKQTTD